jgi:hypothetical protein
MRDITVPGGRSPSLTTQSDQEPITASEIEMVSLTPALEDSNQTHDPHERDVITVAAGVSDSPTTPTVPELGARDQNIDSSCEAANAAHTANPSAYNRLVLDTWVCETVAMIFSIGCVVAIAFTVGYYNGDPIPSLPSGVTINALISVLSTAARAALFFVVSSSIGQLKWCWLVRRGRPLQDVQILDEASRGPLGAIRVLATWTGGPLASLGAVITICMIAFSPFLQQLVVYPAYEAERPLLEATNPQAVNYTLLWDFAADGDQETRKVLASWFDEGLAYFLEVSMPATPSATCSRPATCTWENYRTVGWCSMCRNGSGHLSDCVVKDHRSDNASEVLSFCQLAVEDPETKTIRTHELIKQSGLPAKPDTISLHYKANVVWASNVSTFVADDKLVIRQPVVMFTHAAIVHVEDVFKDLYHSDQPALRIDHINECVLTLCEMEFNVTTRDGVTSLGPISTDYGRRFQSGSCWKPEHSAEDVVLTSPGGGRTRISQTERAFCPVGVYSDLFGTAKADADNNTCYWYYNLTSSRPRSGNPLPALAEDFGNGLAALATKLTDYGLNMSNHKAIGMAFLPDFKVQVRWQWIALPALLELASVILFLSTIFYSRRIGVPIWKSSLLAIYYHQVEDLREDRAIFRLSEMDKASNDASVQISRSGDAQGFMLRRVRDGGALREGRDQEWWLSSWKCRVERCVALVTWDATGFDISAKLSEGLQEYIQKTMGALLGTAPATNVGAEYTGRERTTLTACVTADTNHVAALATDKENPESADSVPVNWFQNLPDMLWVYGL